MEEVVNQDSGLLRLPLEVQARIIHQLPIEDRIRLSHSNSAITKLL